jgi:hypothetical protein
MISDFKHFFWARDKIVKSVIHPSSNRSLTHTKATIEKTHNQILSVRNPFEEE